MATSACPTFQAQPRRREELARVAARAIPAKPAGIPWRFGGLGRRPSASRSGIPWQAQRPADYPEGVASADPDWNSVLLWTRRPYRDEALTV